MENSQVTYIQATCIQELGIAEDSQKSSIANRAIELAIQKWPTVKGDQEATKRELKKQRRQLKKDITSQIMQESESKSFILTTVILYAIVSWVVQKILIWLWDKYFTNKQFADNFDIIVCSNEAGVK